MPAKQGGNVFKNKGRAWAYRYYDAEGIRRACGGFQSKTEARAALRETLDGLVGPQVRRDLTLQELVDEYLEHHEAEANTIRTLTARLKYATGTFGDVRLDRLTMPQVVAWRKRLPAGSAWHIHKCLRQVLNHAVAAGYVTENVAKLVKNPEPKRREVQPFDSWADVCAVADELGSPLPMWRPPGLRRMA